MLKKLFGWMSKKSDARSAKRRRDLQRRFLGAESLEDRRPMAADLRVGINGSGNLIITDDQVGTANNVITIRLVPATGMIQVDSGTSGGGSAIAVNGTGSLFDADTVEVPYSFVTGQIIVTGAGGNDSLTINYAGGNPLPAGGLSFDGGAGNDSLTSTGGTSGSVVVNYTSSSAGSIVQNSRTISYTNFDGASSAVALNNVTDFYTFNLPGGVTNDNATMSGTTDTNGTLSSAVPTFVRTSFTQRDTTALTVNLGASATTTFNIGAGLTSPDSTDVPGGTADRHLTVNGGLGVDNITSAISDSDWDLRITLNGDAGNDSITGGTQVDLIYGGDGDDTLNGGAGDDNLYGGIGNDTLTGGTGGDDLFGQDGNDSITGGTGSDAMYGGNGNDTIVDAGSNDDNAGLSFPDTIDGGSGNDTIQVAGDFAFRNDIFTGGAGIDTLALTASIIRTSFSTATNSIEATSGAFAIVADDGGATIDLSNLTACTLTALTGGDGNDVLTGTNLALFVDNISGNVGNDTIYGLAGNDVISGGAGDDRVDGGYGADTITGGADNDVLYGRYDGDTINGNDGIDAVYGDDGNDSLSGDNGVDSVFGGYGNDIISDVTDDSSADALDAGGGNDTILVNANFNTGTLNASTGTDTLVMSAAITRIDFSAGTSGVENLTTGGFAWIATDGVGLARTIDLSYLKLVTGALTLTGGTGNDTLIGTDVSADTINGNDGDDTLSGLGGNDTINGGDGADRLLGGLGADTLTGDAVAANVDVIFGGSGDDTIRANAVSDDTVNDQIDGEAGADTLLNTAAAALSLSSFIASSQSIETINGNTQAIQGTIADNVLNFRIGATTFVTLTAVTAINGLAGNDTITGNNAVNTINGGTGNDSIYGLGGNDVLNGDDGDDYIEGGNGDDTITDGLGADTMKGGPKVANDNDTFILSGADVASTDVILDFNYTTYGDLINIAAYANAFSQLSRAPYVGIWYPNGTEVTDDGGKKLRLAGITNVNSVIAAWFGL